VARFSLVRIHNPWGRECGCDESCFCKRTRVGYALRWYIPARFHRFPALDADTRRALVEAFDGRDLKRFVQLLDPAVVWRGLEQPGEPTPTCRSREKVRGVFEEHLAAGRTGAPEIVAESDGAVVVDPHPDPAIQGLESLHHLYTFRRRRIVSMQDYVDRQHALAALDRS
jgi:ketosteroid isomerase-like protein